MSTIYQNKQKQQRGQRGPDNTRVNPLAGMVFTVFLVASIGVSVWMDSQRFPEWQIAVIALGLMLIGMFFMFALKIAPQWEKAVVLRLGKFRGLRGPGVFWIIPLVDAVSNWVDHRVMVSPFSG